MANKVYQTAPWRAVWSWPALFPHAILSEKLMYHNFRITTIPLYFQEYPNEGLTAVVRNVFDFDSYNKELRETLVTTMQKHGIPLGAQPDSVQLATE